MIIYNVKERIVYDSENKLRPKRKLSITEGKLLMLLSDNALHTHKDMLKYIKRVEDEKIEFILKRKPCYIHMILSRLRRKIRNYTEIKIETRNTIGVYMKGELWLE